jgi:hypothetical protein
VICAAGGLDADEAFRQTQEFITSNSEQWRLPEPDIDYRDPFCRMAYLYMNVAAHATLVERTLAASPDLADLIKQKIAGQQVIRICALGGGPGSELLGVVRFIESIEGRSGTAFIDVVLVDQVKEWDESWHALKEGIDDQMREEYGLDRSTWPVSVSRSFLPLDTTSVEEFRNFATRFNSTDLYILSYLVSELKGRTNELTQVIDLLVQRSSAGAFLLFIDRDERVIRDAVHEIIDRSPELVFLQTAKEHGSLPDDPEALGEWYINIESLPRRKWLAFSMVARKQAS